jgi:hypothetical protein
MIATTRVQFFVGANYEVGFFKKISSSVKSGFEKFPKPGEGLFFLMKIVGRSYPPPPT